MRQGFIIWVLAFFTPWVGACDAPENKFCVDFFDGKKLQGEPRQSQQPPYIKYNWKNRSPGTNLHYDNFSARWRGRFDFEAGAYEFRVLADDGVRIFLDGKLIINHWKQAAGKKINKTVIPGAGTHLVEVEYFDAIGNANIEVDWQLVSTKNKTLKNSLGENNNSKPAVLVRNDFPMGVNLSLFRYWSSAVPFKDLMIQSGKVGVYKKSSNKLCAKQPPFDQHGFPQYLPTGCVFRIWSAFHIKNEYWPSQTPAYKAGRYVLLYKGKGEIRIGWDGKDAEFVEPGRIEFEVPNPETGIEIVVTKVDPSNPITDIHLVHIEDEINFQEQPFNEQWLALLRPFSTLRFMDWGAVSENNAAFKSKVLAHTENTLKLPFTAPNEQGLFNEMVAQINIDDQWPRVFIDKYDGASRTLHLKSPIPVSSNGKSPIVYLFDLENRHWSQRTSPTSYKQGTKTGVAFEYMIKLANILKVNPWITIPTAADDDFVENLARLVKEQLDPDLKCYIEYSNETWNYGYQGYHYSEAQARLLGLTGTVIQADAWHAYRAVEIFKIFNQVFEEADISEARKNSRLIRVLTSQTAWLDRAKSVMDWKMPSRQWPTNGLPAYKYADAWAITTYFGVQENLVGSSSVAELMTIQKKNIQNLFGTASQPGKVRQLLTESMQRKLQLVAYEGGAHLLAPSGRTEWIAKLAQVNQQQGMKSVYLTLFDQWQQLKAEFGEQAVGVLNHYYDVGRYSQHGYWGLLQSTYQDIHAAPKYQAVMEATQP